MAGAAAAFDASIDAARADGEVVGGGYTVYAVSTEAVHAVLQRLEQNDPECTSAVLTVVPPYNTIAKRLAEVLGINTFLTSLKLELDPEGDPRPAEIFGEGGPIELALQTNAYLTVLEVKNGAVPDQWREFCHRNSSLLIPAPRPLQQSNPDREVVDLTEVSWALPEDDRFSALPLSDMISSGGMGMVYKIDVDGEVVAAKAPFTLINPEPIHAEARQTVLKDCMRELHALRRLDGHPNIVGFRCVFYASIQNVLFPKWICMDYVEKNLYTRIRAEEVEFLPDAIGIVNGLEFIHSQGMMHRDIKPQNILVRPDGTVQVADLGYVRICHVLSGPLGPLTNVGTKIYLAPDIVEGDEYDPGRDVYAFGVTAVQMILNEDPADSHDARMAQVERAMSKAPDFAYLFRKCCEWKSCDRPSCRGLKMALKKQEDDAQRVRSATEARKEAAELKQQLAGAQRQLAEAATSAPQQPAGKSAHSEQPYINQQPAIQATQQPADTPRKPTATQNSIGLLTPLVWCLQILGGFLGVCVHDQ